MVASLSCELALAASRLVVFLARSVRDDAFGPTRRLSVSPFAPLAGCGAHHVGEDISGTFGANPQALAKGSGG